MTTTRRPLVATILARAVADRHGLVTSTGTLSPLGAEEPPAIPTHLPRLLDDGRTNLPGFAAAGSIRACINYAGSGALRQGQVRYRRHPEETPVENPVDEQLSSRDKVTSAPIGANWTVTVTETLPDCPSVDAAWERIATQTKWGEWRSASKMRGTDVTTKVVAPAVEPLKAGDEYVVHVGRLMKIRCRVLESSSPGSGTGSGAEMVFDAVGRALGGIVDARFRFTVFRDENGVVTARAQEKMKSLPLVAPSAASLEKEHRHTFRELNASFRSPDAAGEAARSGTT